MMLAIHEFSENFPRRAPIKSHHIHPRRFNPAPQHRTVKENLLAIRRPAWAVAERRNFTAHSARSRDDKQTSASPLGAIDNLTSIGRPVWLPVRGRVIGDWPRIAPSKELNPDL